jgi:hypothetical protein
MSLYAMKQALKRLECVWSPMHVRVSEAYPILRRAIAAEEYAQTIDMAEKYVRISDKNRHEWVGLTDDEVFNIYKQFDSLQFDAYARSIEAKLREKNLGRL